MELELEMLEELVLKVVEVEMVVDVMLDEEGV